MHYPGALSVLTISLVAFLMTTQCLADGNTCPEGEVINQKEKCQVTCTACRDCGPCLCAPGYIRRHLQDSCIPESHCHQLHLQWMKAARNENKKDKFFNCE